VAQGGAVFASTGASLTSNEDTFERNKAQGLGDTVGLHHFHPGTGEGGALYLANGGTLTDVVIRLNSATVGPAGVSGTAGGGGIFNSGTLTISGSTISANTPDNIDGVSPTSAPAPGGTATSQLGTYSIEGRPPPGPDWPGTKVDEIQSNDVFDLVMPRVRPAFA